jgi:hypothetical protein
MVLNVFSKVTLPAHIEKEYPLFCMPAKMRVFSTFGKFFLGFLPVSLSHVADAPETCVPVVKQTLFIQTYPRIFEPFI